MSGSVEHRVLKFPKNKPFRKRYNIDIGTSTSRVCSNCHLDSGGNTRIVSQTDFDNKFNDDDRKLIKVQLI